MAVKIDTDVTDIDVMLARLEITAKHEIPLAVRQHSRLLCVQLAHRTQPFSIGQKGKGSAYEYGVKRVEYDVGKVVRGSKKLYDIADSVRTEKIRDRMRLLIQQGHFESVEKILRATKILNGFGGEYEVFKSAAKIKSAHRSHRSDKTGRTWVPKGALFIADTDARLASYVKEASQRVGFAKGGWADCARKINVLKGDNAAGIPAWAKKKTHGNNGKVIDETQNTQSPSVTVENSVSYINRILPNGEGIVALEYVSKQFEKYMVHKFNAIAKKLSDEQFQMVEQ